MPADQVVYTVTGFGGVAGGGFNGTLTRDGTALNLYDTFTQKDLDDGLIAFEHDGHEDFHSWVGLSASAGVLVRSDPGDENSPLVQDQWNTDFHFYITPVNDAPEVSGSSHLVIPEGETAYITTGSLGISDPDDANSESWLEGTDTLPWVGGGDNFAVNHDATGAKALKFEVTALPDAAGGVLEYDNGTDWVAVTAGMALDASIITGSAGTTGLRYVHNGSEVRSASFQVSAIDRWGDASAMTATVTIQITNVNDGPQIASDPQQADPPIGTADPNNVGPAGSANNPLTGVPEGGFKQITTAELQAYDPDSTDAQVQYRVTRAPSHGQIAYSTDNGTTFTTIGAGSSFTQADVAAGYIYYLHNGDEAKGNEYVDSSGAVPSVREDTDDYFVFTLADGDKEQPGNQFWIFAEPTNDAPTVTAPGGPIHIDSQIPANNPVSGFSVADSDLTDDVTAPYETDFVQVTVRLLDQAGNPIANYTTGFGGGGVQIGHAMPADVGGLWVVQGGNNSILQFQGTREQVNQALAGLTVTFNEDLNQRYRVQVIADDRLRDASGDLVTTGSDANGGEMNQATTPGGAPTAVDGTQPNWAAGAPVPSGTDALVGNISAASVEIWASHINEPAVFTGPASVTVNEDVRTQINGFKVSDPESDGLGTPITVTISVPNTAVHGTLSVGSTGAQTSLTPAGGEAVTITGDNSRTITLTGRAQDIQALLNGRNVADDADDTSGGLFYRSGTDVNHDLNDADGGDVTLTLSLDDAGSAIGSDTGSGSQANNPADITTPVTITAVNDAPSVSATTGALIIEDTGFVAVPGFVINDRDANDGYAEGEADEVIEVTVRVLNNSNAPLSAEQYEVGTDGLGITLSSTSPGAAVVDTTGTGVNAALQVRGTREQLNAYLAGLQVQFANADAANVDQTYRIEVIVDDRLRDAASGDLVDGTAGTQPVANGGDRNQNPDNNGLGPDNGAIPTTEIAPYDVGYVTAGNAVGGLYNLRSNSRQVFISTVNDPGDISAGDITRNEGNSTTTNGSTTTVNLGAIAVADPDDNGASDLTVTVSVPADFTISNVGGSGGTVTGVNSNAITITGNESQINSRLSNITVQFPDPSGDPERRDWHGSFDVTVVYNDQGNTGLRPDSLAGDTNNPNAGPGDYAYVDTDPASTDNALQTTRVFTVTVNPVNDAPVVTDETAVTLPPVSEDTDAAAISGDTVGDLFAGRFSDPRDAGTANDADSFYGVAIVGAAPNAGQGEWQYRTDGGGTWTAVGSRDASNALVLDKDAELRFVPAADFHGTPAKLTVRLVETDDNNDSNTTQPTNGQTVNLGGTGLAGVGGATVYSAQTIDLVTSVTNVNDAPEAVDGSVNTVEDVLTVGNLDATSGWSVTDLAAALGYDDTTDNQSGVDGGGNAEQPAVQGLAIVGDVSTPDGTWHYHDGTTWAAVPTDASSSNALVLSPTDRLAFVPNPDYNGTPTQTLDVRLTDQAPATVGTGVNLSTAIGEPDSHWSAPVNLAVKVAPRNDAPDFGHEPTNPNVTENDSTGSGTSIDPVYLLDSGSVTDIDLGTTPALTDGVFGAGSVTAQLTDGMTGDVLQLGGGLVAGANGIATVTGGTGSTALVITFTPGATVEQVEAVLAAIQYTHTSDDPTSLLLSGTPDTVRSYTITLSDGNNVDAQGDDAGGPAPLTATKSGTITINATNDPPVATDNNETISEGTATVDGNVITDNDGHGVDSDPDTPLDELDITHITPPAGGSGGGAVSGPTTVEGLYGTLTVRPDGSYTYALNNDHPAVKGLNAPTDTLTEVFGYTLSDGSATDTADLTITITGVDDPVTVDVPNDTTATTPDGDITDHVVFESGLPDGSSPDADDLKVSSSFTVVAEDGLDPDDAIVVGYTNAAGTPGSLTLTKDKVEALATTNQTITTRYGELVLNGASVGTDGTVTIDYIYTLTTAPDVDGTDTTDSFSITANDRDDDSDNKTLNIKIVDDAPAADPDANAVTEGATVTVDAADGVLDNDTSGADGWVSGGAVVGVVAGSSGTPTTGVGTAIEGDWGTLTLNADGSYAYTSRPDNGSTNPSETDVFTYTVRDADGDETTTTLSIAITNVTLPSTLVSGTVLESGLPDGSAPGTGQAITGATLDLPTGQTVQNVPGNLSGNTAYGTYTLNPDTGTYSYTLTTISTDVPGVPETDSFTYVAQDADGNTVVNTVTITIVDDVPEARPDANTIAEDDVDVTGNVLTGGSAEDQADVPGADHPATVTHVGFGGVPGTVGAALNGSHGSLVVNANGSYTYTVDNADPAVQALAVGQTLTEVFTYTITDADGDTSSTTLTITITGTND
ncbi:VCBS domain-containing protein, partial [Mycolicibacterium sp.]|uniref:VCBS domain-containing protein n=1 Tax=Mycolicibacterium sp. TaxID=2320850 RepID=UPI003560D2F6